MKKKLALLLVVVLLISCFAGCGGGNKKYGGADQQYLFGMDYIIWEGVGQNIDYVKALQVCKNMGVKSIRNWMHVHWFFNDDLTRREANIEKMHEYIEEAYKHGFQLIGMSHKNFNVNNELNAKPMRDVNAGSYYLEWLEKYEKSWELLAAEFPEITYWEIDNENNNVDFMPKMGGGTFTVRQMADIYTDMLFAASRGIKKGNPNAITVMGGLITKNAASFLEMLYKNIKSGKFGEGSTNPDDYFECLAWHPYPANFNADKFVEDNDKIYQVVLDNDKPKKVFLTEIGGWTRVVDQTVAETYIPQLYEALKRMPYVESAHYYRMFNNVADHYNNGGLFYDPDPNDHDLILGGGEAVPGSPKVGAYAYQKAAGGTGPLDLLIPEGASIEVPEKYR